MNNVLAVDKITITTTPVISLADAKAWLKIDGSDDDVALQAVIDSVIDGAEQYTCKAIRQATIEATIEVGADYVPMPYGPVMGAIEVYNERGDELPNEAQYGDKIQGLESGVYRFVYNAGWITLPAALKTGLLRCIAFVYENRGDEDVEINFDSFVGKYKSMAWV